MTVVVAVDPATFVGTVAFKHAAADGGVAVIVAVDPTAIGMKSAANHQILDHGIRPFSEADGEDLASLLGINGGLQRPVAVACPLDRDGLAIGVD